MDIEPTYATTVLSQERLSALDAQLASMEVSLNLLRFAPGDRRGMFPWSPYDSPSYCRQVAVALDHFGSEIEDDDDMDSSQARDMLLGETEMLTRLDALCDRLRNVLALSEEVMEAVGSDVMGVALDAHAALERAGRAGRIKPWWENHKYRKEG